MRYAHDPATLAAAGAVFRTVAEDLKALRSQLHGTAAELVSGAERWSGPASERFTSAWEAQSHRLSVAVRAFGEDADALSELARSLGASQATWAGVDRAAGQAGYRVDRNGALIQVASGTMPADPDQPTRAAAMRALAGQARADVATATREAATRFDAVAALAPGAVGNQHLADELRHAKEVVKETRKALKHLPEAVDEAASLLGRQLRTGSPAARSFAGRHLPGVGRAAKELHELAKTPWARALDRSLYAVSAGLDYGARLAEGEDPAKAAAKTAATTAFAFAANWAVGGVVAAAIPGAGVVVVAVVSAVAVYKISKYANPYIEKRVDWAWDHAAPTVDRTLDGVGHGARKAWRGVKRFFD
jgi:hypothetical protein